MDDYYKINRYNLENYEINNQKLYAVNDAAVLVNAETVVFDSGRNILLNIPLSSDYAEILGANIKNGKHIKYVDEAMNLAVLWSSNYWHFTFQVLDKINILENNGYSGKYMVYDKPYIRQLLNFADVPEDRVIFVKSGECYKVSKLHILMNPHQTDYSSLIEIKDKILSKIDFSDANNYPEKLYIRRIGDYSRKVINEEEVLEMLKKQGFTAINPDDYTVKEQIKYFHNADIVVSPHGACSTNALYMKNESHFVECFGSNYIWPCMLGALKLNNMDYRMVVETRLKNSKKSDTNYSIPISSLDTSIYKFAAKDLEYV